MLVTSITNMTYLVQSPCRTWLTKCELGWSISHFQSGLKSLVHPV